MIPARAFGAPQMIVQPVGIGVFLGGLDIAEGEIGKLRRWVLDAFDFEAEVGQGIGDLINRRRGVEMVLEPGESEFHCFS